MVARLQIVAITTTPFTRLQLSTRIEIGSVAIAIVNETIETSAPNSRSVRAHSAFI
jgi:hypothetical protein